jgi:hypothetical protein
MRWLDDPALRAGFKLSTLLPDEVKAIRGRLRHEVEARLVWIAVIDNIRVAALITPGVSMRSTADHEAVFIPRLYLPWLKRDEDILQVLARAAGDSAAHVRDSLLQTAIGGMQPSSIQMTKREFAPTMGRSAWVLGPVRRNQRVIGHLRSLGFDVRQSLSHDDLSAKESVDLVISSGYHQRLPVAFVNAYHDRIINLHAARLPWGRGIGTTLFAALLDYPFGVSVHLIDAGLDTGDLLCEQNLTSLEGHTLRSVYECLIQETNSLFEVFMDAYLAGRAVRWQQPPVESHLFARNRDEFETVLGISPDGYDTALSDVALIGNAMRCLTAARSFLAGSG